MRPFQPEDLDDLNQMHVANELEPVGLPDLPGSGWIEPGVAAGFLYLTDSNICLFDGLVTNPQASAEDRHRAIESIQKAVVNDARVLGFKQVVAVCTSVSLLQRGLELYGYKAGRNATLLHLEVR